MLIHRRPMLFSVLSLSFCCFSMTDLQACGGRGGYGGGYRGGYSRPAPPVVYHVHQNPAPMMMTRTVTHPVQGQVIQSGSTSGIGAEGGFFPVPEDQTNGARIPLQGVAASRPVQGQPVNNPGEMTARMTALQMLGGDVEVAAESPSPSAPDAGPAMEAVGTWIATLPNQAVVQLELHPQGSFQWTAVSKGKRSTFEGSYTHDGGSLSLIRSNDQQKLDGSLEMLDQDSFRFQLSGMEGSALKFTRR